jgi:carbamoyltransferase
MPAITHVDFSARVQTVNFHQNQKLYLLLQAFKKETNCSVLVNTSFNVRGEPIVMTAQQAFDCFTSTEIDILVIDNKVFTK